MVDLFHRLTCLLNKELCTTPCISPPLSIIQSKKKKKTEQLGPIFILVISFLSLLLWCQMYDEKSICLAQQKWKASLFHLIFN